MTETGRPHAEEPAPERAADSELRRIGPAAEPTGGSLRYLLDLDSELAESLDVGVRLAARRMTAAVVFGAGTGELSLDRHLRDIGRGPGVLIIDGVLAVNVTVGDRVAAELLGAGDLLEPDTSEPDELFTCSTGWRVLVPARLAVLDDGFAERVSRWPQLTQVLLTRAERRTHSLNVQRAITCQPRLEIRLALLLLHLASRWGHVEPGGVRLTLPLTHQLLGRLIGAERPSVSHALARLARSGLVTGAGDEWHLHARVDERFDAMLEDVPAGVAPLRA
ncbi:MAG TPA: helix-turn-helix domain-containing protein [Solirubrobacteraceae bacterium]|nr:helix-turn-helix domain-containing protein [Solirubrobacteraceae bacterium]